MTSNNSEPQNAQSPQSPSGYYYAPLTEGGTFQSIGENASRFAFAAALVTFTGSDPARATNTAMGGLGNLISSIGGTLGQYIDNISTFNQNFNTLMTELNDSNSWMPPGLGD